MTEHYLPYGNILRADTKWNDQTIKPNQGLHPNCSYEIVSGRDSFVPKMFWKQFLIKWRQIFAGSDWKCWRMHAHAHTHTHAHEHKHTSTHAHAHVRTHSHTHTHTHTCTHAHRRCCRILAWMKKFSFDRSRSRCIQFIWWSQKSFFWDEEKSSEWKDIGSLSSELKDA